MPSPVLTRRSLSRQLVLPVVGLVLAAVLANVVCSAWLAARRSAAAADRLAAQVAAALAASRVPPTAAVLDTLDHLTGCRFLTLDPGSGRPSGGTLPSDDAQAFTAADRTTGRVLLPSGPYRLATVSTEGRPETLVVLAPIRSLPVATLEAVAPTLAVAAATLLVLVPLGLTATRGLARRIAGIEEHVAQLAAGAFEPGTGATPPGAADDGGDEIDRLTGGVNRLAGALAGLRQSLVAGERQRLLGQLAAGFAHELRNAITGSRLAIDLHRRRCPGTDTSLAVAVRQLDIVEEEVRGLLALGRPGEAAEVRLAVDPLLAEVRDLTQARCEHAGVHLACAAPSGFAIHGRREPLRAALVNLALNAIDAAGPGGWVRLGAAAVDGGISLAVEDSGAGPPAELAATLHEPFVTGKPEGVGLGLAVASAVAGEHGGRLAWEHSAGRTRFAILVPAERVVPASVPLPSGSMR
jgi:signal transduction histidine kinase